MAKIPCPHCGTLLSNRTHKSEKLWERHLNSKKCTKARNDKAKHEKSKQITKEEIISESKKLYKNIMLNKLDKYEWKKICDKTNKINFVQCSVENEKCSICLNDLTDDDCVKFDICADGHYFHENCLRQCLKTGDTRCPVCRKVPDIKNVGNCPGGTMEIFHINTSIDVNEYDLPTKICTKDVFDYKFIPGFENLNYYVIYYRIYPGIQIRGPHNNPDHSFNGAIRIAYLPDCEEGRNILNLYIDAFKRRLTFRVGFSQTRNRDNCICWNIHHKTTFFGEHGFADFNGNNYKHIFERMCSELYEKGITFEEAYSIKNYY